MPDGWGFAYCYAINNHGELAGFTAPPPSRWATRYTNDGGWEMMSGIGNESAQVASYDINDHGTVIMEVGTSVRTYMDGVGAMPLIDLLSPKAGNWLMLQNLGGAVNNRKEFGVIAMNLATNESGVAIMTPIPQPNSGDITGDGSVNIDDLLAVIGGWGPCPAPPATCPADVEPPGGNDVVDINDLLLVISNWG